MGRCGYAPFIVSVRDFRAAFKLSATIKVMILEELSELKCHIISVL